MPTPSEQLLSRTIYDVDGTTTVWNFSFTGGYLDPSHVKAYTELPTGVRTPIAVTPEMLIGEFQLQIAPALPSSAGVLVIYRDTPKDLPLVDFVEGPLSEIALDTNAKQAVFIAAEAQDTINTSNLQAAIDAQVAAQVAAEQANIDANTAASAASAAGSSALIASNAAAVVSGLTGPAGSSLVGYTPAGTGAVATDVQSKLRERVSVKDYGATGNGTTDDTSAIQLAVNNIPQNSVLYFPKGSYKITAPIVINRSGIKLVGDASGASLIVNHSTTTSALIFTAANLDSGTLLYSCSVRDMSVVRPFGDFSATAGYALELIHCDGFLLRNFAFSNTVQGIRVAGGQNNILDGFVGFSRVGPAAAVAGSSMLRFEAGPRNSGINSPAYTTQVSNFSLSGTSDKTVSTIIAINSGDGINFSNGYVNFGSDSLCRIESTDSTGVGGNITQTYFTNVYFDGVTTGSTGSRVGLIVPQNAAGGTLNTVRFVNCAFSNYRETCVLVNQPISGLSFVGCTISGAGLRAFDVEGNSASSRLMISACQIAATVNGVRISTVRQALLSNNAFRDITGTLGIIRLEGASTDISITGNVITGSGTNPDLVKSGTVAKLLVSGNIGANATNTIGGTHFGNSANSDATTLDWYEEGSFTPNLNFGGDSVGVTYSNQIGRFTRIGNLVTIAFNVTLTSKGTSTGELRVGGLPYPVLSGLSQPIAFRISNTLNNLGEQLIVCDAIGGASSVRLAKMNTSGTTEFAEPVTNVDISDTFFFSASGTYRVS